MCVILAVFLYDALSSGTARTDTKSYTTVDGENETPL